MSDLLDGFVAPVVVDPNSPGSLCNPANGGPDELGTTKAR